MSPSLPRPFRRKLQRQEITWLLVGLSACVLLFIFVLLAGEVMEGETQALDVRTLRALRTAADPSVSIGPAWLEFAFLDLTALGGMTVIGLVVCAVAGFLFLQGRRRTALIILFTTISGDLVGTAMKHLFARPRPTVVPHLREVLSSSFPSGHAMDSAIVYLTLGAMLMRVADRRATKLYCLAMAALITLLVGVSRVYLGVHYPTDVIGGWILGFAWASVCWLVAQRFDANPAIMAKRDKPE
jgi:undecaprenyl-diphosphatase